MEVRVPGDGGGGNVDWSDGRAVGPEVGEDRVLAEDTVPGPGPHTGD